MGFQKLVLIDYTKCKGCDKCTAVCKFDALHKNGEYYQIDHDKCFEKCRACELVCPHWAVTIHYEQIAGCGGNCGGCGQGCGCPFSGSVDRESKGE